MSNENYDSSARGASYADLVAALPPTVPFVAPEALERMAGKPIRLRIGANESPFGVSPKAAAAMREAIPATAWYGDPESLELRTKLSKIHNVNLSNIVMGSGIDDLLGLIVRTFINPGDIVINSLGGYPTFNYHVNGFGGVLKFVPYKENWKNDLDGLAAAAHEHQAKLVYLSNPDNPTGTFYGAKEIAEFVSKIPTDATLLLDEAYVEFANGEDVLQMDYQLDRVIRLRTFSKAYGMAGARIGYAVASAETIAQFEKIRLHFGVNRIAQAGASSALEDHEFVHQVLAEIEAGRKELAEAAKRLGYTPIPTSTSFILIHVGSAQRAKMTVDELLNEGVFIRSPGAPRLNECIRVTIGDSAQRREFIEAWEHVHQALKSV